MSELRKAAQQALEYLAAWSVGESPNASAVNDLIAELEAALAQPEQEPVAWMLALPDGRLDRMSVTAFDDEAEEMLTRSISGCTMAPLYTHPPRREWQGLTEEELRPLCKQQWVFETVKQWAQIIEAALKEKNHE